MPDVSFKKKAHAVSEALGYKHIINNEECDECNQRFGRTIESRFISFIDTFRSAFGVVGKRGCPKFNDKDIDFEYDRSGKKMKIKFSNLIDMYKNGLSSLFISSKEIIPQDVYRALVKFSMSSIRHFDPDIFDKTVAWINGEFNSDLLTRVYVAIDANAIDSEIGFPA